MEALPNDLGTLEKRPATSLAAMEEEEEALPDIHSDLQREVLLRVPYKFHEKFKTACRRWQTMMNIPQFYDDRKVYGKSEQLICLKQICLKHFNEEIVLYDPVNCTWERIPCSPDFTRFQDESKLVSLNGKIVLLGGSTPPTIGRMQLIGCTVFIYDFQFRKWRRGADMRTTRFSFACSVSSSKDFIYVAGGFDELGETLATAEVYDVESDKWEVLPPMPQRRKNSLGVFMEDKFMVISGTRRNLQRHLHNPPVERSVEVFDTKTSTWNTLEDMMSLNNYQGCVSACGNMYVIDSLKKVTRKYDA